MQTRASIRCHYNIYLFNSPISSQLKCPPPLCNLLLALRGWLYIAHMQTVLPILQFACMLGHMAGVIVSISHTLAITCMQQVHHGDKLKFSQGSTHACLRSDSMHAVIDFDLQSHSTVYVYTVDPPSPPTCGLTRIPGSG